MLLWKIVFNKKKGSVHAAGKAVHGLGKKK